MVKIYGLNKKFSYRNNFVLYDWKDSGKDDFYFSDEMALIYFFIKDLHPEQILDRLFLNPMKGFKFLSGIEPKTTFSGKVVGSNLEYLFTSFEFPRATEFNWANKNIFIKRDTNLSWLKNETEIMKYLSKYID